MSFEQMPEKLRKENLKILEDKRVRFAEKLESMGFAPDHMIFFANESGSFTALSRVNGKYAVITGATFAGDDDFRIEIRDHLNVEREDIFEKGTGLNGAFGFGVKGAKGFKLHIILGEGDVATMPVVAGRTSWMETSQRKNPLLKTKRRRGDANIIWDMMPIEPGTLTKIENLLATRYFN